MGLLFSNTEELKESVGWLYSSVDFEALKPDLELAKEDICKIISSNVYKIADNVYNNSYSGLENDKAEILLRKIQLPMAMMAVFNYMQNADISHEQDGRKVKIDKNSESIPWQWQIEADNAAMLKKISRAIDSIIAYLDENAGAFPEWGESDQRRDMKKLFVPDASAFDEIIPINQSRQFFIRILPFVRQEDKQLRLLVPDYTGIKDAMSSGSLTDTQADIVDICREIVVFGSMVKAVRRFSTKILPDAVVQLFESERNTQKASKPAGTDVIKAVAASYQEDYMQAKTRLFTLLKKQAGVDSYDAPTDYSNEKFFTT